MTCILTIMVGPAGAGKSTWIAAQTDIHPTHVISSDQVRADLCGDFKDQSRNEAVFAAVHDLIRVRLRHGLPCVVDATNLRAKDRMAVVSLAPGGCRIRYVVIDRPMDEKRRDGGWRNELTSADGEPFDLIGRHASTFAATVGGILRGDGRPEIEVVDLRSAVP